MNKRDITAPHADHRSLEGGDRNEVSAMRLPGSMSDHWDESVPTKVLSNPSTAVCDLLACSPSLFMAQSQGQVLGEEGLEGHFPGNGGEEGLEWDFLEICPSQTWEMPPTNHPHPKPWPWLWPYPKSPALGFLP